MFVPFVCCDCDVICNSKGEGKDWTREIARHWSGFALKWLEQDKITLPEQRKNQDIVGTTVRRIG